MLKLRQSWHAYIAARLTENPKYHDRYEELYRLLSICPIALEPMYDPILLNPSGHSIDKSSLEQMSRHQGDGASIQCPNTKQEINGFIRNIASRQQNERVWERIEKLYDEMISPPVSLPEVSVFRGNASAARGESGEPLQKRRKP